MGFRNQLQALGHRLREVQRVPVAHEDHSRDYCATGSCPIQCGPGRTRGAPSSNPLPLSSPLEAPADRRIDADLWPAKAPRPKMGTASEGLSLYPTVGKRSRL